MNDKPTKDSNTSPAIKTSKATNNTADNATSSKGSITKDKTTSSSTANSSTKGQQPTTSSSGYSANSAASDAVIDISKADGISDGVFGLIVLAILVALVIWAVVSVVSVDRVDVTLGELQYPTTSRVGDEVSLQYMAEDIPQDSIVEWYVDDVRVYHGSYGGSDVVQYQWQPTHTGSHTVQLRVGDSYTDKAVLTIARPLATIVIQDYTMQYGDPLPQLSYTVEGIAIGEDIGCSGSVVCSDNIDGVGVYPLTMTTTSCTNSQYEVECNGGNLIVIPRRLAIDNIITKQYDGTNSVAVEDIQLVGTIEGDDVCATADMLYFSDKHVGSDKSISSYNIQLCGLDSDNYTLEGAIISGSILPRPVALEGTTVEHKVYDGTNSATISNSGMLSGTIDGDSVAIGYIDARYNNAKIGKDKDVVIDNITLVGSDSGNYTVTPPPVKGRIVAKYLDLITGNDAVTGSN